jgi:cytidylate kinase
VIRVITIDREYGSGAPAIAAQLAKQRNWALWDQRLTSELAKMARCEMSAVEEREERKDSAYYRLLKSFVRGGFEGNINAEHLVNILDTDSLVKQTQILVRRAAAEGNCVIVGRGSACFLQDMPDAFHVFVYSTKADKMRRLQKQGRSASEAESLIESVDRERAAFVKHYHGKCWPDRSLFNLMVNSACGEQKAVEIINNAVAAYEDSVAGGQSAEIPLAAATEDNLRQTAAS